jgi:hypothetical protein
MRRGRALSAQLRAINDALFSGLITEDDKGRLKEIAIAGDHKRVDEILADLQARMAAEAGGVPGGASGSGDGSANSVATKHLSLRFLETPVLDAAVTGGGAATGLEEGE